MEKLCIDTLADLRALAPGEAKCLKLLGYHTPGDGGGGDFYWDAAANAPDNSGTIISSTSCSTGRWKRLTNGPVSVKWFGARGDGTANPSDTVAIQNAIDQMTDGVLFFPSGSYVIDQTIEVTDKSIILAGEGMSSTELMWRGSPQDDAVRLRRTKAAATSGNYTTGAGIRDLRIWTHYSLNCTGAGIHLDNVLMATLERVWVRFFNGKGTSVETSGCGLRIVSTWGTGDWPIAASQDLYLAHVHLQGNQVGMIVDGANQVTAVNLMVNQNLHTQALFKLVSVFQWCGGLIQGGASTYGLHLAPTENIVLKTQEEVARSVQMLSLEGVWFEFSGPLKAVVKASPPPGNHTGCANLSFSNCRFTAASPSTFFDLSLCQRVHIYNNRILYNRESQTLLRFSKVFGAYVGFGEYTDHADPITYPHVFDIDEYSQVTWVGSRSNIAAIGIYTNTPPVDGESLKVGGSIQLAPYTTQSLPAGAAGQIVFDTTQKRLKYHDGSSWLPTWAK